MNRPLLPRSLVFRRGSVLETYPGLGLGNYLYFALRAHIDRAEGRATWVLDSGLDVRWRGALPLLIPLLTTAPRALGRRWRHIPDGFHQRYGSDFTPAQLERFITEVVLPSRPSRRGPSDLVVNVRRGDYYANPEFRKLYGFDVVDYLRRAVSVATSGREARSLVVVSDDVSWCRAELPWLSEHAEVVTFGAAESGPVGDFWEVANGRTLILTNSTFSYWAAYVSQVAFGGDHGGVWAPDLHQRNVNGGRPWQHDPRWQRLHVS